jgi:hypothetical protein
MRVVTDENALRVPSERHKKARPLKRLLALQYVAHRERITLSALRART